MTEPAPLHVTGTTRERLIERRGPLASLWFGALAEAVSVLPVAPDTQRGRARRSAIKVALLIAGLLIVLAGYEQRALMALGVLIMALAPALPLNPMTKRDVVRALKKRRFALRQIEHPATITHDGRRLILQVDGERRRRVLTNRRFSLQRRVDERGEGAWVGVAPRKSSKKSEAIWLHIPARPGERAQDKEEQGRFGRLERSR